MLGTLILTQWRDAAGNALATKLIPHLIIRRVADQTEVLRLERHVTSSDLIAPRLVLFAEQFVPGVEYEAISLEADGSDIAREIATAS